MAKTKTGTSTIIQATRLICRMVGTLGAYDLASRTNPAFNTAVLTLVSVCRAWEALDDFPGQIDNTGPISSEDGPPAG